jgi:Na+/melibiose symporter-like transporter
MIYRRIYLHLKRVSLLRLTLINMGLLDELISGFTFIGLPLLRDQLGLSYEQIGLIFSVAGCSSMLLVPALFLLSDRGSKRWWILGGQLGLACAFILAGSAPLSHAFILLLAAFALVGPAGAAAVALSQAALIDSAPGDSARTMTRWTLLSSIGDFLSPFAVTTIVALGLGWSGMCLIAAGCWLVTAVFVWSQRFPHSVHFRGRESHDPPVSVLAGLRQALRDGVLLRWAVLSILTTMLDEVFLAYVVLYLRDVLYASAPIIGVIVAIQMAAAFIGLFIMERLLGRIAPTRLLTIASSLTLLGVLGFLFVRTLWFAPIALFVLSLGSAGLYPLVESEAYNRLPGRSGTVRAIIGGLGQPFEIVLPGIVGLIAGRFGLLASLGFLGIAPVLFLLLAPRRNNMKNRHS